MTNALHWSRTHVLAEEEDDKYVRQLRGFSLGPPGIRRLDLARYGEADDNAILIWIERSRDLVINRAAFTQAAVAKGFMLLPRDGTPIPADLAALRRLEWTNAADVYWQWRVANGAPLDHVRRPKH